jgi:hypothetical protein
LIARIERGGVLQRAHNGEVYGVVAASLGRESRPEQNVIRNKRAERKGLPHRQ